MAKLDIIVAGNPVLRLKAKEVERIDKKTVRLLNDMAETMYAADGVGLAAPQVGVSRRIVVIDVGEGLIELINRLSPKGRFRCRRRRLSVGANFEGEVERAEYIECEFLTVKANV
ncbi:MAG: peptide deformylase [Phascolarctobacterium faecium]